MLADILHIGGTWLFVQPTYASDGYTLMDASSGPTVTVRKNGVAVADVVGVTDIGVGLYELSYSPSGEVEGDQYVLILTATVDGRTSSVTYKITIVAIERGTNGANTVAPDNTGILAAIAAIDITPELIINATAPALQTIDEDMKLTIHRGDYTEFELTLGSLAGRTGEGVIFTIKEKKDDEDDDAQAYLQVTEESGLRILNKESTGLTASDGEITVLNETTGQTRFRLKSALTNALPIKAGCWYDAQKTRSDGDDETRAEGRCDIEKDVTRVTS